MAQEKLRELGEKLESPPASKDALVKLLKQAVDSLSEIDQSPPQSVLDSLKPCFNAFAKQDLLKHQDNNVRVLVATCLCEVTRITAPEAPYSDDVLKDIFHLIVSTFSGLSDINNPSFGRRVIILETLARYRSCVMMLDLECDDLINEMFQTFFTVASEDHSHSVINSMQTIMVLIIQESEEIQENLLLTILSALGRKKSGSSSAVRRLAMNVIEQCMGQLEASIKQFLVSSLSGDGSFATNSVDHYDVIFDLYQCGPHILTGIVPYITGELLTDKLDVRAKAVELLGEIFAVPGKSILESFQPLFTEFLKRLTDRVVEVRVSVIEHLKNCLLSHPSRPESPQIIQALCDRLLDYDENVRKKVVAAICDVACNSLDSVPAETARLVADRLRDTSVCVKKYTMERLSELYRLYCQKSSDGAINTDDFEWIPGKILKCFYDKDFRPETVELTMITSLFPPEFSIKEKAKHWVLAFSGFDKVEVKAFEQILLQKQRLQQEMQKYLSLRQTNQEEAPDLQKRIAACFRSISRSFNEHAKAEESLNTLNQLKDSNVWNILSILLDPHTSFSQAWSSREELLKILGEKHPLYDFMSSLSVRCSHLMVDQEYVKEFLFESGEQKSTGNAKLLSSCMNLLMVIASYFPLLFSGSEETLVNLLKEDNETLKEGIAHVLAKAGGTLREQLANTSSSIDLLLERLCLEGTRKQAKYSVHALAAITKDDGLKSLSVLYKRLVDMLEEKVHLPAVLQSLGCIAQISMPIFETREEEIIQFINTKILESTNQKTEEVSPTKSEWGERTELCLLKIYGIKTLVKSYLPSKDAQARAGIDKLLGILKNILSHGDIAPNMNSSAIDKAHLRLASAKAVLRLSRQWDSKIPPDVYYLTLRISQDEYAQSRNLFLGKVHQYIKERVLDAKYASAFLLNVTDIRSSDYEQCKRDLYELVQILQQVKLRQLSIQSDMNLLISYPEYIVSYLVHALAHDRSCPEFTDSTDIQAFGTVYWRLHLFLSVLLIGDESSQAGSAQSMNKESFDTVVSILRSIKFSQDLVDANKTKTLHAISDLALLIAKRLVHQETDAMETETTAVPLPNMLYSTPEKIKGENGLESEETWSAAESVVAHFEALKVEDQETIDNENLLPDTDGDGNEIPLGRMLEIIKDRGAKKKKSAKKQQEDAKPADPYSFDAEDDILGLVKEINSETGGRKVDSKKREEKPSASKKRLIERESISAGPPTPKRKRSGPTHQSPIKKRAELSGNMESKDSLDIKSPIKSAPSKGKKEVINDDLKESNIVENSNKRSETKKMNGSVDKRKRTSVSGLEKCSSQSGVNDSEELVGSRIKVWWPLDKQFYEGVVKSYDSGRKKHVILYDDGDKEVLSLAKEKWELLSNAQSPAKRQKSDQKTKHKELSSEKRRDGKSLSSTRPVSSGKKISPPSKKKGTPRKRKGPVSKKSDDLSDNSHSDSEMEEGQEEKKEEKRSVSDLSGKKESGAKKEEKVDSVNSDGNKGSDDEDEPLSTWRVRTTKVT